MVWMIKPAANAHFGGQRMLAQPALTRDHLEPASVWQVRRIVPGLAVRANLRLFALASKHRSEARKRAPTSSIKDPSATKATPRSC